MNLKNYILESQEPENLPEILDFVTNIISQYTDSLSDLSDYSESGFKKWCEDNGIGDMDWDDDAKKNFYKLCDTALSNMKDTDDSVKESFEILDLNILLEAAPNNDSQNSPKFSKEDAQKLLKQARDEVWSGMKTYGKKKATNWSGDQLNKLADKIMVSIKNKKTSSAEEYANAGISAGKAFSKVPGIGKALAGISALSGPQVALITVSVAAVAAGTVVAVRQIKKKKNEKILAGVKAKVEEYKKSGDTEKAKFYGDFYEKLKKTCLDDKGKPRVSPDLDKLPEKDRDMFSTLYNRIKKNKNIIKAGKTSASKEHVVKDKDGSEIHARRKKTGIGMTYVRMKDGKEIGYATKDEFRAAKSSNESYTGLSDFIRESVE